MSYNEFQKVKPESMGEVDSACRYRTFQYLSVLLRLRTTIKVNKMLFI
jgi:hypothetical protein